MEVREKYQPKVGKLWGRLTAFWSEENTRNLDMVNDVIVISLV